jgi:hypothetical protein
MNSPLPKPRSVLFQLIMLLTGRLGLISDSLPAAPVDARHDLDHKRARLEVSLALKVGEFPALTAAAQNRARFGVGVAIVDIPGTSHRRLVVFHPAQRRSEIVEHRLNRQREVSVGQLACCLFGEPC